MAYYAQTAWRQKSIPSPVGREGQGPPLGHDQAPEGTKEERIKLNYTTRYIMIYPIGRQNFENLRNEGFVYVDKTALIYKLVKEGSVYFLSRPRRFGKSLLLSTLEAYFCGKKELFKGLAIEQLEKDWHTYPVLHLDLNAEKYENIKELENILDTYLREWENKYNSIETGNTSLAQRFRAVIRAAKEKTGRGVAVLIDEYDKPILQAIGNPSLQEQFRNTLKAFYGVLKSADADLKFALLTGVTKFSKVSVFSDLNNLKDISMSPRFHNICGITEEELHTVFDEEIGELAAANNQTKEEAYAQLRTNYDGYHFSYNTDGIYNPFSILWTLSERRYGSYWFSTGTPTYLVELIKKTNFNIEELSGYEASEEQMNSIHIDDIDPIPVLYQSGYLTIKDFDGRFGMYTLDYPNEEVKSGFVNFLLPFYTKLQTTQTTAIISKFVKSVERGKADDFMRQLQSLMAGTPYELIRDLENHYQNVVYIITKLMGLYVQAEYRTSNGRIDILIGTNDYIYIIELKFNGTAQQAIEQINEKNYSLPFATDGRKIIEIGANVSKETRSIEEWIIIE